MDEIKASPGNATALALVGALRSLRGKIRPEGDSLPAKAGQFAVDAILPEGIEREVENLAYGNMPLQMPTQSNIPQFKRGRADDVMDLVGAIPTPTKVASVLRAGKSHITAPIENAGIMGGKKNKYLLEYADEAERMAKEGATPQQIWNEVGVTKIPRTEERAWDKGRWGQELVVDKEKMPFKREILMTPSQKSRYLLENNPGLVKKSYSPAVERFLKEDVPNPGNYKMDQAFELGRPGQDFPFLNKINYNVMVDPGTDKANPWLASYMADKHGTISMNLPGISGRSGWESDPHAATVHELMHGFQHHMDMPSGSNVKVMGLSDQIAPPLQAAVVEALRSPKLPNKTQKELEQLRDSFGDTATDRYAKTMGEKQARMSAERSFTGERMQAPELHRQMVGPDLDSNAWYRMTGALKDPKQLQNFLKDPIKAQAEFLIHQLRKK